MKQQARALRAIAAELLAGFIKPTLIIAVIVLLILSLLTIWLATSFSSWWLLLLVPVFILFTAAMLIIFIIWLITSKLRPRHLSQAEQKQLTNFTEKIMSTLEMAGTPLPLAIVFIAWDILRGRGGRFIRDFIDNSSSLKHDFSQIVKLF